MSALQWCRAGDLGLGRCPKNGPAPRSRFFQKSRPPCPVAADVRRLKLLSSQSLLTSAATGFGRAERRLAAGLARSGLGTLQDGVRQRCRPAAPSRRLDGVRQRCRPAAPRRRRRGASAQRRVRGPGLQSTGPRSAWISSATGCIQAGCVWPGGASCGSRASFAGMSGNTARAGGRSDSCGRGCGRW